MRCCNTHAPTPCNERERLSAQYLTTQALAVDLYGRAQAADKPDAYPSATATWTTTNAPKVARAFHSSAVCFDCLRLLRDLRPDEVAQQRSALQRSKSLAIQLHTVMRWPFHPVPCEPHLILPHPTPPHPNPSPPHPTHQPTLLPSPILPHRRCQSKSPSLSTRRTVCRHFFSLDMSCSLSPICHPSLFFLRDCTLLSTQPKELMPQLPTGHSLTHMLHMRPSSSGTSLHRHSAAVLPWMTRSTLHDKPHCLAVTGPLRDCISSSSGSWWKQPPRPSSPFQLRRHRTTRSRVG